MSMLIFLGVIAVLLIYAISLYNHLVNVKHAVSKAWANIDVLLKQRHDELPKLVEVCKQYKQFEQATLQKVIEARSQVHDARERQDIGALGQAEGALRAGLGNIFAVAEAYPELKANENFMQLQNRITSLENGIADRRELYNDAVNINNVQIEVFPASIIAGMFDFGEKPLLEFSATEKADVDMKSIVRLIFRPSMLVTLRREYAHLVTSGAQLLLLLVGLRLGSRNGWLICLAIMAAISILAWLSALNRLRAIRDTPTSKIASAAQGYVELTGRGHPFGEPLLGKLSLLPCLWYRYKVERRESGNKWKSMDSGES